jgi:low temperature requirement protein LtrA
LLRERRPHEHNRVTTVELFFDLVFVFAITQISHFLLAHFTPLGALQSAILMLAVWWVWVFTAWITNWLDPEQTAVRLMLFALMVAGLLLSTSTPKAFEGASEGRGLACALAYSPMQVARSAFFLFAVPKSEIAHRRNFIRILAWLSASGRLLADPNGHSGIRDILGMTGGPLLYLTGVILFKRSIRGHLQPSHLAGIGLFVILTPFAHLLTPLTLSAASTVIMLIVAIWEAISLDPKHVRSLGK